MKFGARTYCLVKKRKRSDHNANAYYVTRGQKKKKKTLQYVNAYTYTAVRETLRQVRLKRTHAGCIRLNSFNIRVNCASIKLKREQHYSSDT